MTKNTLLTLQEAADILRLKDLRTVLSWGRQGRFVLIGSRKHVLVNAESLQAYTEGRSVWHAKQQSQPAARVEPEPSGTSAAARSRSRRRSNTVTAARNTTISLRPKKLRRILTY